MQNTPDGFLITVSSPDPDESLASTWLRYTWGGRFLARSTGSELYPSPDGTKIAIVEPLTRDQEVPALSVVHAVDTASGRVEFRVVGAGSSLFGWTTGENRWLADNSGVAVGARASGFPMFAMRDGTFRPYIGVPSPTSTAVFSYGGVPVDANQQPIVESILPASTRSFVPPWGDTGEEIRFLTPHLGHGGPQAEFTIVRPYVDTSPQGGPPEVQLEDRSSLMELRDAPAGELVAMLWGPQSVMVHETRAICSAREDDLSYPGCTPEVYDIQVAFITRQSLTGEEFVPWAPVLGTWARVTTGDGLSGWILVDALIIGF
jgi:hypothetical protein